MKSRIVSLLSLHGGKDVKRVDAKKKGQKPFVTFLKKNEAKDVSKAKVKLNKRTDKVEKKGKKKKSSKVNTQLEDDVALLLEQSKSSKNKVKKSGNEHSKNVKTDVAKKKDETKEAVWKNAKALTLFSRLDEKDRPKENKIDDSKSNLFKTDEKKNIKEANSKVSHKEKTSTSEKNFDAYRGKDVKVEEKKTSNDLHALFTIRKKNDNDKIAGKEKSNAFKSVNIAKNNIKNNITLQKSENFRIHADKNLEDQTNNVEEKEKSEKNSDQKRVSSNEMAKNIFVNSKDERKGEKKNDAVKRLNSTSSLKGTTIKEDEKLKSIKSGNSNQFQKNSQFQERRDDFENVVVKITKGSQENGHMKVNFSKVHLREKIEYVKKHDVSKDYGSLPQLNREKGISQVVKSDVTSKTPQMPKSISTQVVTAISKALENQRPPLKIQIQLNPPQLGKVIIEVTEKAGKTSLLLSVENDKTRELMKMALPIMTNQLSNLNFNVTNVQINGQQWFDSGQSHQEQKREQNERKKEERGNNFNEEYKEFRKEEV